VDDQLLLHIYHRLFDPDKAKGDPHPSVGCVYPDAVIVLIYLLACVRGRSPRWAAARRNWPLWMRRLAGPGYSQFMKRLKTHPVQRLLALLFLEYRDRLPGSARKYADGKPLTVGGFTKDPDATRGKLPGGGCWGRGYKVHVLADATGAVQSFSVTGLAAGEATAMRRLVAWTPLDGAVVRADSNYDSNPLYAAVADRGGRLIAPRKKPRTGLGHHPQHADRLRAIGELEAAPEALAAHRRERARVERTLGHVTNLPFGLAPLPNFVRRLPRVALWVLAKLTLYHIYLNMRNDNCLAA